MKLRCSVLASALLGLVACGDDGGSGTSDGSSGSTSSGTSTVTTEAGSVSTSSESTSSGTGGSSGGFVPVDCSEACSDLASDAGIAVCYSCRCKNAMDGYLPSVEELQCSQAEVLPLYTADVSGAEPLLVESDSDLTACVNPQLLYQTCHVDSRLGQLQVGDIFVKWVCRSPVDGVYDDMGAIMYNARTGASCWFDDIDGVTTDDNVPDFDLMEAGEDNLNGFLERFYFTDGESCTRECHDADPFVYTPMFEGIQWFTGSFALGPHVRTQLDGTFAPIDAQHLVSPEASVCATCHRLGSAAGCDFLGPDALGDFKTSAHEMTVVDAQMMGSPNWELAYWMPSGVEITSFNLWEDTYGEAKAKITECCANPGVDSAACDWEPIPSQ